MNGTNASIKQMVKAFNQIANSHAQLNDFYAGTIEDLNAIAHKYPLLSIDLVDIGVYEVYSDFVWRVSVFDTLLPDKSNQWDIISDANKIVKDILLILRDTFDLQVEWGKAKQTPVINYLNDDLSGVFMDVTISIPDDNALNQVPLISQL